MIHWQGNVDTSCVFCQEPLEIILHLFFKCQFSIQMWEALMKGVMKNQYTMEWASIIRLVTESSHWSKAQMFIVRYILQSTVHTIWRERNRRRHGEASTPIVLLVKRIDKNMRNRFSILQKKGDKTLEEGMRYWFANT